MDSILSIIDKMVEETPVGIASSLQLVALWERGNLIIGLV